MRAIATSLANIFGWTFFSAKSMYELINRKHVSAGVDDSSVLLLMFYMGFLSPVLTITFDKKIRNEFMEILRMKRLDLTTVSQRTVKKRVKTHQDWSLTISHTTTTKDKRENDTDPIIR